MPVSVAQAAAQSIPVELRLVGAVEASATVQVKSQVAGQLIRVHFTEGTNIAKDALLFEIDDRPYREALRQAEAAVERDRAQLAQAEANVARDVAQSRNADADVARNSELAKAGVIAKAQLDQIVTSADMYRESVRASRAAIETARATLASGLAAIDKARLDLSYCQIRAPMAGRAGNLLINEGNLVKSNDVPLVVIHQVSPVFVTFGVPEQHLAVIRRLSAQRALAVKVRNVAGRVSVIDNAVDTAAGVIRLKAVFDNKESLLWPGEFVDVDLSLDTITNATVVPSEAVQAGQQGTFVYLVKPDTSVEARPVVAGRTYQNKTVIEQGVGPGDTVVTDGHLRLFPGAHIKPVAPVGSGRP